VFAFDEIGNPTEASARVFDEPHGGSPFGQGFDGAILGTQFEILQIHEIRHGATAPPKD